MSRCSLRHALAAMLAAAAFASPLAFAHGGDGHGPRMGPGMMGGYGPGMGPGMMGGYGPCTSPGMMNGYGQGMGPGMMNGYGQGMGPGMMNGYGQGMGPGMMNGYGQGMGPGTMNGYGQGMESSIWAVMNEEQRQRARTLMEQFQQRQAEHGSQMMALQQQLMAQIQAGGERPEALAETRNRMAERQREMWQERQRLQQSLFELLDDEQRRRLAPQATP